MTESRRRKPRSKGAAQPPAAALERLAHAANHNGSNVFERVVACCEAQVTHGEIVACLRRELGFGQPLVVV